jgi:hypothetical protein
MPAVEDRRQMLLVSNSTVHGSGYLDHVENEIRNLLGHAHSVLFIPFALQDRAAYTAKARDRFRAMGIPLTSVHDVSNVARAVHEAEAFFIGGGNTFGYSRVFTIMACSIPFATGSTPAFLLSARAPARSWRVLP